MRKIFFYKKQNIKNHFYCKWIFDLDKIYQINEKNLLIHKDKDKDFKKKLNLTNKYKKFLFKILYLRLKKVHKNNISKREYKILLGRWIKFYVDTNFFRYNYLIDNIKKNKIEHYYFKFNETINYIPNTTSDYIENVDDQERNNYLNWKILNYIKKKHNYKKIKIFHKKTKKKLFFNRFNEIYNLKGFKFNLANTLNFFLKLFLKKNSPIIVTSYLPRIEELLLQLKNKTFFLWQYFFYKKNYELNLILRKKKIKRDKIYIGKNYNGFKGLLLDLLDDYFPKCFLENYKEMHNFVKKNMLVQKPNFIFTSNEFVYNEFFKSYLILAIQNKSKYVVGQHGSAYGSLLDQFKTTEEETSDYFLTWGWKQVSNHIPVGMFNIIGKKISSKSYKNNSIKNLVLINTNYPHKKNFWDINEQYLSNFHQQLNFLKFLDFSLFKKVIVRCHPADNKYFNFFKSKYKSINKKVIIDYGNQKIENYLNNETLVVFSYLSSGFFELFSRKFNCLSFDNLKKDHYQKNFLRELKNLKKKKFFFEDGILASKHINDLVNKRNFNNLDNKVFDKNNLGFIKKYANSNYVNLKLVHKKINK